MHPSSFSCAPPPFINLEMRFLLRGRAVTPRVMENLIKSLKMKLSLKVRENQSIKVSNQNLNYRDFQIQSFQVLFSVDRYTQQANFQNFIEVELDHTSKNKLFFVDSSTSVQIFKNYRGQQVFVLRV
jgi:hypothetical protein